MIGRDSSAFARWISPARHCGVSLLIGAISLRQILAISVVFVFVAAGWAQSGTANQQFIAALQQTSPQQLSVAELELLSSSLLPPDPVSRGDAWGQTLVWRFGDLNLPVARADAFTLHAQGMPWSRIEQFGSSPQFLPALALEEVVRSGTRSVRPAIEWYHQLKQANLSDLVARTASDLMLNLLWQLIGTSEPPAPSMPDPSVYAENQLWLWQQLHSDLGGSAAPVGMMARIEEVSTKIPGKRSAARRWGRFKSSLSRLQGNRTHSRFGSPLANSVSNRVDFGLTPPGNADQLFRAIQQHKAGFLPQTETVVGLTAIQEVVGSGGMVDPSLAIEFVVLQDGYLALVFDRVDEPRNACRVLAIKANTLAGILDQLRNDGTRSVIGRGAASQAPVILGIDAQFQASDYSQLDRFFRLSRSGVEKCLLCPSLSVLGGRSRWTTAETLRYAHFSGDFELSQIPTAQPVRSLAGRALQSTLLKTSSGPSLLMVHSIN